jgi:hypothetical protein
MVKSIPVQPRPSLGLSSPLFLLVLLVVPAVFAIWQVKAPPVGTPTAPSDEFSITQAKTHVEAVAQQPHPMGTAEHERVRTYIVEQLTALGLESSVQETATVGRQPTVAGTVRNVLARLPGTDNSKAILLLAHYDSVPEGPGAGDDAAGVAVLLDAARALKAGSALKNDVIFLFSDAEENGLLGAKAFVDEHPWAADVGLVLNLEARGHYGPSLMFETSEGNGRLIQEFAQAVRSPQTSSLFFEVYKLLPQSTDFTVFKRAGIPGMNFAFINGLTHYHSQLDSIQNLSEASLQHQGDNILAMTKRFGNLDLTTLASANAVYFNLPGGLFIHYPAALVLPLMVLVVALFAGVVFLGFRRGLLSWKGMALGFGALLAALVSTYGLVFVLWSLIRLVHSGYAAMPAGDIYNRSWYFLGFPLLTIALNALLYAWFFRRASIADLTTGALLWSLLLSVVTSLLLPGGSYLFVWPLFFSLLGLGWLLYFPAQAADPWRRAIALSLTALPSLLLLPPSLYLLFVALTVQEAAILSTIVALSLGLLLPHLHLLTEHYGRLLPGAAATLGVLALLGGSLTAGFDASRPQPTNLFYGLNANTGEAVWASANTQTDSWTSQYLKAPTRAALPDYFPHITQSFLQSAAPAAPLAAPAVAVEEDRTQGDIRTMRFRITSERQAPVMLVYLDSKAQVLSAQVNGKLLLSSANVVSTAPGRWWGFTYHAPAPDGIELTVELKASEPFTMRVVDATYALPQLPGTNYPPRPANMLSAPFTGGDATLVSKSFIFEPQT